MLGFTRRETGVLLFLVICFIIGLGVRIYRDRCVPLPKVSEDISVPQSVLEKCSAEKVISQANQLVSLNRATQKELEQLPGLGPVIAKRIVEYREKHGEFQSLNDLVKVKGIGVKRVDKLISYLKLN